MTRRASAERFPPAIPNPEPSRCPGCRRTYTGHGRGFRVPPGQRCPNCGTSTVALRDTEGERG